MLVTMGPPVLCPSHAGRDTGLDMLLPGRLSASTLGDLLGGLHREGVTGLLELSEIRGPRGLGVPGRLHRIHLRGGLVVAVDTALPVPRLGEILRREGRVTASDCAHLLACIEAGDRRAAGEILASEGIATAEAIRAALASQLRERLEAVFMIQEASVAFRTARPLVQAMRVAPLQPREFLHGRPRARDRGNPNGPALRDEHETPPPRSGVRPVEDRYTRARRVLGLADSASDSDVKRAFRRLASELHPDRVASGSPDEQRKRAARFAEISAAYHLLVA